MTTFTLKSKLHGEQVFTVSDNGGYVRLNGQQICDVLKAEQKNNFIYLATNITNANNVACAWSKTTNQNNIFLLVENTSNDIIIYNCNDLSTGNCIMSLTLGTGVTPAIAINSHGNKAIFFRTSASGGSINRVLLDNQDNIITSSSAVVTGGVTADGLAAYWYDDVCYLIYNHTTNGITVVSSKDYGTTFS